MKRSRPVAIRYPKTLLLVNDERMNDTDAYLFEPLIGEQCSRLMTAFRDKQPYQNLVESCLAVLCDEYRDATQKEYETLSRVCLIDTKIHIIAKVKAIQMEDIWEYGPMQVEYVCIKSTENDSDSSSSFTSSEDDSDSSM